MTKKEIVKRIAEQIGLTQVQTKEIVGRTFEVIVETLVAEGRIEFRNFGVFEVKKRSARRARNPRTGAKVYVPEKLVVIFKPGKGMDARVQEMQESKQQQLRQQASGPVSAEGHLSTEIPVTTETLDNLPSTESPSQS